MTRQKVAILGGGMAALATAFELTQRQDLRDRFEITIYQMGWRLGGKGASGRDNDGRVVEHGLHIWFGCYENAFRMLEAAYQEWKPQNGQKIQCLRDALKPQCDSAIGAGDSSDLICLNWPTNCGVPGDGMADLSPLTAFSQMLFVVHCFYDQLILSPPDIPTAVDLDDNTIALLTAAGVDYKKYANPKPRLAVSGADASYDVRVARCAELASEWSRQLARMIAGPDEVQLRYFVSFIRKFAKAVLSPTFVHDRAGRFMAQLIDVGTATIKGIVMDMMLGGLTVRELDLMDFREWLAVCGAARDSTYGSPIVQALYDSMLQYCDGDRRRPSYGAGTAAQAVVRLYGTYRGSFAFEMQSGMGEVVVVPIYRVLKQRGVKFKFFWKLKRLELDPQKGSIARIIFDRQVDLRNGEYCPTIAPKSCNGNLECWPEMPLWDQICDGQLLCQKEVDLESHWCTHRVGQETLQRGDHFNTVVLAIPLGAFKKLNAAPGPCDQLVEANSKFRAMTEGASLVPSISIQIWCTKPTAGIGYPPTGAIPECSPEKTVISTGPHPLDIWADMSQVLQYERPHVCAEGPISLHYLCGVLETDLFRKAPDQNQVPAEARKRARELAIEWLTRKSRHLWPGASPGGQFDWNVLFDPSCASGPSRIDSQLYRANIDPSSCCVASNAGSTQWRLATDASGFDNLYLAGAWIDTGFNTECIEAAVMSGMQAARAVSGASFAVEGEDFLRFGDELPSLFALAADGLALLLGAVVDAANDQGDVDSVLSRRRSLERRTSPR
ncbi:NAD(P)-binding protein [Bradyrhizobium liaoningense]|uniref:NAD(P)-binding protein n=1 Tax=Bradyrhizobium liaoningense TaxID=43992 RepID=UPI001BACB0BB|nr:NAD(P)-binding protein [Bradyrhizobium liaoningense]MBR0906608.1 NAD(P)-binding protein [Bradyrhizobium liaoningense]